MGHSPGFLRLVQEARKRIKEIAILELKRRLESGGRDFLLIDVREDHEWAKGHLPKAEHLGRGILERDIEKRVPDKNRAIILYCGGGFRSALAADNLQRMGYTNVRSLWGGFRGWVESGGAVEK